MSKAKLLLDTNAVIALIDGGGTPSHKATLINYHEGEKGAQRIKTSPQFAQNINFCALFAFVVKNFSI